MVVFACALFGALHGPAAEASLDRVTLQLKWRHQFQFAGYYAAVAQGYYREAGLDVTLREAEPGKDPVQEVLAGRAEFGVGNSDLLMFRAAGKPVVLLACIFQHSPLLLVVRAASGVNDLQGLHDRPMMMIESEKAELFAYFKYEGLDVKRLHVQPHTLRMQDFIDGKVDAMSAYGTDEPFKLHEAGVAFHAFTARSGGIDFYGDNLYTTEAEIREHPERVRAFRAASLRGWEYALTHPQEIVDIIRRDYPSRLTRPHLEFEAVKTAELMHPGIIEVGHMNPGRWRHIADTYAEFGMLPRDFDLTGFLYDPNPQPDLRWLYWVIGILGAATIAALGWVLPLYRLNRRLRVANAAAEAANLDKDRYLAFITHELRTPIGGMVGVVNLLKEGAPSAQQREYIEVLDHSSANLLRLVDSVLDHSKLEAGKMEIEKLPVDLSACLREIVDLFAPSARTKGLALKLEILPGVPAIVPTDALRLRQVLTNLLSNAVKFTAHGEIKIWAEVAPSAAGGGQDLCVRVRDTGPGIAPEQQTRIFTPFTQADSATARNYGGSGLGLSISRQLAKLLGGELTVESTPGLGSTFTLRLPLTSAAG